MRNVPRLRLIYIIIIYLFIPSYRNTKIHKYQNPNIHEMINNRFRCHKTWSFIYMIIRNFPFLAYLLENRGVKNACFHRGSNRGPPAYETCHTHSKPPLIRCPGSDLVPAYSPHLWHIRTWRIFEIFYSEIWFCCNKITEFIQSCILRYVSSLSMHMTPCTNYPIEAMHCGKVLISSFTDSNVTAVCDTWIKWQKNSKHSTIFLISSNI